MIATLRSNLVSAISPAWVAANPTVPLVFDNQPFDWSNPPDSFVTLELMFYAGEQIGMSASPKTRVNGYAYVVSRVKEGTGAGAALARLEWFMQNLGYRSVGAMQFQAPAPTGSRTLRGYFMEEMKIPFYADEA